MQNFFKQDDDLTHYFRRLKRGRVGRVSQGHKPIYHLTMKKINRSSGRSVVSAVAYASGRKLTDSRGNEFDYSKKDEAIYSELLLPEGAPKQYQNRINLWHAVEKIEKRKNAVLCKTIELSLPQEFSLKESQTAIRELLKETVAKGYCADWSIHDKDGHNPHVHIVLTTRKLVNGKWQQKVKSRYVLDDKGNRIPVKDPNTGKQKIGGRERRMWKREKVLINEIDTKEFLTGIRKRWEYVANSMLPDDKKIDSRSYKERGLEIMPTIHEGYYARNKEENSLKRQYNNLVKDFNSEVKEINSRLEVLKAMGDLAKDNKT